MAADRQKRRIERALSHRAVGEDQSGRDRTSGAWDELQSGKQEHHAEGCEQVGDAKAHDQQAICEADRGAGREGEDDGRGGAKLQHHHCIARHHEGEGGDRADRQIKAVHRQRDCDADAEQGDDRHRLENAEQVVDAQERRFGEIEE
jgi:hypothetical protein